MRSSSKWMKKEEIFQQWKNWKDNITSKKQIRNEDQSYEYSFDFENEQHEAKRDMEEEESESSESVHTSSRKDEEIMERLKALLTSKERAREWCTYATNSSFGERNIK